VVKRQLTQHCGFQKRDPNTWYQTGMKTIHFNAAALQQIRWDSMKIHENYS
jgi:hypothetical protein